MGSSPQDPKENEALDDLITAAFLSEPDFEEVVSNLECPEPVLSEEDQTALDSLGEDLVERIRTRAWPRREAPVPDAHLNSKVTERKAAGAMFRRSGEGDLTPEAKEEIEQRIRELQEEDNENPTEEADRD